VGVFRRSPSPSSSRPHRQPALNGAARALTTRISGTPAQPLPYNAYRPITAAARQVNLRNERDLDRLAKQLRNGDGWQQEAWEYYDAIGEIKYALTVVANLLSRVRLYAGFIPETGATPLEADPDTTGGQAAMSALSKLDSVYGGQPGFMRDASLNFQVAGECFLVQVPAVLGDPDRLTESWDVRSVDEVIVDVNHSVRLRTQRRQTTQDFVGPLPRNAYVARLWRPHPRFSEDADSSMLALRELCSELLLLNRTYRATARSRLNAGALYLPDGLSVAAQPDTYDEDDDADSSIDPALFTQPDAPDDNEDDFEDALVEAMTTPISDESSASSIVPLIIRGPAELGEKIKQFKFERSFDAALTQRADRVLDRIMQGIDVPKDVVTGLANVKYANAIQINEDLYKAHLEPLALLICDCLTTAFLRPAIQALGVDPDEAERYCVWYDPSGITTRPDRSEDADAGVDRHLLSGSAWRTAHGFTDDDAPSPVEVAISMLVEKGTFTPELTEALLTVIAPDVMANVRSASQAANPAPLPPEVANALAGEDPTSANPGQDAATAEPAPSPAPPPVGPVPPDAPAAQPPLPDVVPQESLV
jgi:hypothetical protein